MPSLETRGARGGKLHHRVHTKSASALVTVKVVHTVAWAILAGCVLALPVAALAGLFSLAGVLAGVTLVEVAVLALNGWQCPLTVVAARHTDDRRPNFDIYLPCWLAQRNKSIFGTLFVVGLLVTVLAGFRSWGR